MRIKDFEIKNLYGKYSFKSQLDEKVNIIVGNNGAFKSTLLEIVRRIMTAIIIPHESTEEKTITDYENAYISFDNDIVPHSLISSERRHEVDKINNHTLGYLEERIIYKHSDIFHVLKVYKDDKELDTFDSSQIRVDYISTFDIKDKDINTRETLLDKQLTQLQSYYGYYLNGLQKQFTSYLNKQGSVTKGLYDKIYTRKTLFENLVNGAFKETGKVIDNESEKLRFIIDGKTSIEASQLSSGEKQLLIILLTVLLEDGREYVLMMDEPEISLHISWQYELLNWILELNPNVQLILTTHSPSIFSDGWGDKAIYMEDITTKK